MLIAYRSADSYLLDESSSGTVSTLDFLEQLDEAPDTDSLCILKDSFSYFLHSFSNLFVFALGRNNKFLFELAGV